MAFTRKKVPCLCTYANNSFFFVKTFLKSLPFTFLACWWKIGMWCDSGTRSLSTFFIPSFHEIYLRQNSFFSKNKNQRQVTQFSARYKVHVSFLELFGWCVRSSCAILCKADQKRGDDDDYWWQSELMKMPRRNNQKEFFMCNVTMHALIDSFGVVLLHSSHGVSIKISMRI